MIYVIPYEEPDFNKEAFNCPYCNAYAHHIWRNTSVNDINGHYSDADIGKTAYCTHCKNYSFWYKEKMIVPNSGNAPLPSNDLPEDIKTDFEEARSIVNYSSRGAAALLRLCVQKLCINLGGKGKNINEDISTLVKNGLPVKIQKALDIVRVIGNNSVHPGLIDIQDNQEIANKLFNLINLIVDVMISQPKEIDKVYNNLPEKDKKSIKKRDNK